MFSFLKNMSANVALAGAEDAIDKVNAYTNKNPQEKDVINMMSINLFKDAITSLGISFNDNLLSQEFYTPDFHRIARHFQKTSNQNYAKNTAEWAAANLAMAGFSILGASPDLPKRERVWELLHETWEG